MFYFQHIIFFFINMHFFCCFNVECSYFKIGWSQGGWEIKSKRVFIFFSPREKMQATVLLIMFQWREEEKNEKSFCNIYNKLFGYTYNSLSMFVARELFPLVFHVENNTAMTMGRGGRKKGAEWDTTIYISHGIILVKTSRYS